MRSWRLGGGPGSEVVVPAFGVDAIIVVTEVRSASGCARNTRQRCATPVTGHRRGTQLYYSIITMSVHNAQAEPFQNQYTAQSTRLASRHTLSSFPDLAPIRTDIQDLASSNCGLFLDDFPF